VRSFCLFLGRDFHCLVAADKLMAVKTPLSLELVAERAAVDVTLVERCRALGLVGGQGADGFTPADIERLRLIRLLLRRGIELEAIARVEREQGLVGRFLDLLFPSKNWPSLTVQEAAVAAGVDAELAAKVWGVAGFAEDGTLLSERDVEALRQFAVAVEAGLPFDALMQLVRVYADALGRVAEAETRLFHFYVHERLRGEGLSGADLTATTQASSDRLMSLVEPAVLFFHQKGFTRALRDDLLLHMAEESGLLPPPDVTGQLRAAVLFVDLAGFTSLTEAMGDLTATEVLERFSDLVRRSVHRCDGRIVKQIGDAFMIVFQDPTAAVTCARELHASAQREPQFLGTRMGAHWGPVLYREGDYFGATVNLAARVAAEAGRNQLLITEDLRQMLGDLSDLDLTPRRRRLKGMAEDVLLVEIQESAPSAEKVLDPVCGMELGEDDVGARVTVDGSEYAFCSTACLQRFVDRPDRYT
jgi:adenylate cyclase